MGADSLGWSCELQAFGHIDRGVMCGQLAIPGCRTLQRFLRLFEGYFNDLQPPALKGLSSRWTNIPTSKIGCMRDSLTAQEQANWMAKIRAEWNRLESIMPEVSIDSYISRTTPAYLGLTDNFYLSLGISRRAEEKILGNDILHSPFLAIVSSPILESSTDLPAGGQKQYWALGP
ncbi:uncharacterized protein BKCO1_9000011 [Diplodia corticola]|uniref:Uncharacterized protein n=1 Tax=Diplodia corticola TaxID=236234 RepID=A0A1J9R9N6_9PEZI|nr:uncharacterized protein BKCO1_9000011 [Diplodia corticola]OJD29147.1 hypothetical protein BKCO1_9000011 [Diplodia corticola]